MIELVIRLVFSLAVVVGMLLLLAKFSAKKFRGGSGSLVQVVQRQPLSRTSSVAVVTVGSRVLVLGTTEQQVQLLTELDPDELDVPDLAVADLDAASGRPRAVEHGQLDEAPAVRSGRPKRQPKVRTTPTSVPALRDADVVAAEDALSGSVLSAQTWKQAFAAATSAATGRDRAAS
jgi:flagellar protein FliO/FliZ